MLTRECGTRQGIISFIVMLIVIPLAGYGGYYLSQASGSTQDPNCPLEAPDNCAQGCKGLMVGDTIGLEHGSARDLYLVTIQKALYGGFVITIQMPDGSSHQFIDVSEQDETFSLWIGDVHIQRYGDRWFIRYPTEWEVRESG